MLHLEIINLIPILGTGWIFTALRGQSSGATDGDPQGILPPLCNTPPTL